MRRESRTPNDPVSCGLPVTDLLSTPELGRLFETLRQFLLLINDSAPRDALDALHAHCEALERHDCQRWREDSVGCAICNDDYAGRTSATNKRLTAEVRSLSVKLEEATLALDAKTASEPMIDAARTAWPVLLPPPSDTELRHIVEAALTVRVAEQKAWLSGSPRVETLADGGHDVR